jgi:hypothetical protein
MNYFATEKGMNRVLVGVNGAGSYDDLYRIAGAFVPNPSTCNDLNVNVGSSCSVFSVGLSSSGMGMVGQRNTNIVKWTENVFGARVSWSSSPQPPQGVNVDIESFQGQAFYAVTSGPYQSLYSVDPPGFYPLPWPPVARPNPPPATSTTTGAGKDSEPPNMITDLKVMDVAEQSVTLAWTAPGDDDVEGTASAYDVRYLEGTGIMGANWASAKPAAGEPPPSPSGAAEVFTVTGLQPGTLYYFAIKTADEVPNWSDVSNSPSATTEPAPDTIPPAAIEDLRVTEATGNSLTLAWTAPGDDDMVGTASTYDIRYLEGAQVQGANWGAAKQISGEPAPLPAGSSQVLTVAGLTPGTSYYFAIKTADEVPNWSDISNSPVGNTKPTTSTTSTPTTGIAPYNASENTTTTTTNAPAGSSSATSGPNGSSNISVTDLTVSKDKAAPGETVKVIATLQNTGDEASGYIATLLVNGQVESTREVPTLAPGSRDIVEFDFTKDEPASYEIQVGEKSATVLVSRGINWLKILLIILALIALIIILRALIRWAAKKE